MSHRINCLSTHGEFLVYDRNNNEVRTSPDVNHEHIIWIEFIDKKAVLCFEDEKIIKFIMPGNFGTSLYGNPQSITCKFSVSFIDGDFIYLEANGQYLSADPDGSVNFKVWKEVYEKFWLVDRNSLPAIISRSSWFSVSLNRVVDQSEITFIPNFQMSIAGIIYDIQSINRFGYNRGGTEVDLIYDGYKVEKLLLFKPVIYFSAFGREQSFSLLKMCIASMEQFGEYSGKYLILTNKPEDYIRNLLDFIDYERLQIAGIPIIDETDMVCARFRIGDVDGIDNYQPVIYSDFDIICNSSLHPMLGDIVGNDVGTNSLIYVKAEGPLDHQSYGGVLNLGDQHTVIGRGDRFSAIRPPIGFNSGVIGFKNTTRVKDDFRMVLNCIYSQIATGTSRQSSEVYDQPAANYVYNKISNYDVSLIDKYVHPWPPLENEKIQTLGLVHFCGGVGPLHKVERIKSYYDYIVEHHQKPASRLGQSE